MNCWIGNRGRRTETKGAVGAHALDPLGVAQISRLVDVKPAAIEVICLPQEGDNVVTVEIVLLEMELLASRLPGLGEERDRDDLVALHAPARGSAVPRR